MSSHSVVPKSDSAIIPFEPYLKVLPKRDVLGTINECTCKRVKNAHLEQELEDSIRFLVLQPNDSLCEAGVYKRMSLGGPRVSNMLQFEIPTQYRHLSWGLLEVSR
jgi:hypothetical protein